MKFKAKINVMPRKGLLDPQGKAVSNGLKSIGFTQVGEVSIGRHIIMEMDAANADEAKNMAGAACEKLLANQIMESYEVSIEEVE